MTTTTRTETYAYAPKPTGHYSRINEQVKTLRRQLSLTMGNEKVMQEINHARSIFEKYDRDRNGYLDRYEIRPILIDTYQTLGYDFNPSQDDIDRYIEMMDSNGDGSISIFEFELFVLQALENRNIILK